MVILLTKNIGEKGGYMKEYFMNLAIEEAKSAYDLKEIPVGAIVVYENKVIGRGHNLKESLRDPLAHGEILAIREAANYLKSWRLEECSIYVTLEPCMMCSGAIINSRIKNLYIGSRDFKRGCCGTVEDFINADWQNHKVNIEFGILEEETNKVLTDFFKEMRAWKKK